ncbi:MAG: aminotransferase class I/II-fold pyridoxal phosphate-dependent enzyme [Acidobacteriia bacterium]|nr:aminotransferase class I/II-fold pyridoxal phosphate-dependent enzyme [Terriglobia bacterium]
MHFETFELERFQSTWENRVDYNLSESGILPMSVEELTQLASGATRPRQSFNHSVVRLIRMSLGYSQTNGTIPLRRSVAALYPGATEDNIEITNGGSEANFITMWRVVEPRDEVVVMLPNYMQVWGVARALRAKVKAWWLRPVATSSAPRRPIQWAPDLEEFDKLVTKRTKLIAICNPNNPTGAVLTREIMQSIVDRARWAGAWLLADEVYQGAELEGPVTPSFWTIAAGSRAPYRKLIVTNSLSKAYGLPGLRIGWVAGQRKAIEQSWAAHDYTTIGPGTLNDTLATVALSSATRRAILQRTQTILRAQWPILEKWISAHNTHFVAVPPQAGAIAVLHYSMKINSTQLANRLRKTKGVLIVPGDHFLLDRHIRIGYGGHPGHLKEGLKRLSEMVRKLG